MAHISQTAAACPAHDLFLMPSRLGRPRTKEMQRESRSSLCRPYILIRMFGPARGAQ